jgi:large repetitive protein
VDVNTPGTYMLTYTATDGANPATPVTRTVIVVAVADLSVTSSASPSPVPAGSDLTYTITLQNAGPQPALGVALTDALPAGASFASATATAGTLTTPKKGSSGAVTWNVPTLNGSSSVTLTVVVKASVKAGATLTNTATVSSSSPKDPSADNNTAIVLTSVAAKH